MKTKTPFDLNPRHAPGLRTIREFLNDPVVRKTAELGKKLNEPLDLIDTYLEECKIHIASQIRDEIPVAQILNDLRSGKIEDPLRGLGYL